MVWWINTSRVFLNTLRVQVLLDKTLMMV